MVAFSFVSLAFKFLEIFKVTLNLNLLRCAFFSIYHNKSCQNIKTSKSMNSKLIPKDNVQHGLHVSLSLTTPWTGFLLLLTPDLPLLATPT